MPSPFPGMDPYLEDPAHWPNVHHGLISTISALLTRQLRPRYVGRIARRIYTPQRDDCELAFYIPHHRKMRTEGGDTITQPIETITMLDGEFREHRVEIVEVANRQVVTVIEVVSPSNKVIGAAGRRSFVAKRQEILNSAAHWVEIDLLRGDATLDPLVLERLQPHDYYMHVSNADSRPNGKVWLVQLEDRLPVLGIPLRKPDPDVGLDLQSVLNTAYERAAYDLTVDYTQPPVPPLSKEQTKWAKKLFAKRK